MRRGDGRRLMTTWVFLAVCVLLIGGGVLLVASRLHHHRAAPAPAAAARPSPTHSAGSPAPSAPTTSPATAGTASASPSPRPSSPPGTAPAARGLHLVPGPYGFDIPQGWTVGPVVSPSSTVQRIHVSDPASTAGIDYVVAKTAVIYNPDHTVNLTIVGAAIACKPTSTRYVPNKGPRYTCAPDAGRNVNGAILVLPYPEGFKLLQVMLPPQDDQIAEQILSGFHA